MSMLALATSVQSKRKIEGIAGPLKVGMVRGEVSLAELTGPIPNLDSERGMLNHEGGPRMQKGIFAEAQAEKKRRDSVAARSKHGKAATGRRGSVESGTSGISFVSKVSKFSKASSGHSKVSTIRSASSSILSEAAATALLLQQRALEAAMLEAHMAKQRKKMDDQDAGLLSFPEASIRRSAVEAGVDLPDDREEKEADEAARAKEQQLAKVRLAKAALEASMKLNSTIEQRQERENLAKLAEKVVKRKCSPKEGEGRGGDDAMVTTRRPCCLMVCQRSGVICGPCSGCRSTVLNSRMSGASRTIPG